MTSSPRDLFSSFLETLEQRNASQDTLIVLDDMLSQKRAEVLQYMRANKLDSVRGEKHIITIQPFIHPLHGLIQSVHVFNTTSLETLPGPPTESPADPYSTIPVSILIHGGLDAP